MDVDYYTFDFPLCEIRGGDDNVISPMVNVVRYWIFYRDARYCPEMGAENYRGSSLYSTLKGQDRVRFGGASSGAVL